MYDSRSFCWEGTCQWSSEIRSTHDKAAADLIDHMETLHDVSTVHARRLDVDDVYP